MGGSDLVSVVMPSYNREAWLERSIGSVEQQTHTNWELIVIDDRSTDGTERFVRSRSARDARIVYVRNGRSPGPGGARNQGIELARGDLIAFLDSDDAWEPEKLTRELRYLADRPSVQMVGSDYWMIDRDAGKQTRGRDFIFDMLGWWEQHEFARKVIPCAKIREDISAIAGRDAIIGQAIGGFLWIHTSSVLVRREVFDMVGQFNEQLLRTEDIELWLRINNACDIGYLDEPLSAYDITGRNSLGGDRYRDYEPQRAHSPDDEVTWHLRLYHHMRRHATLTSAQRAFVAERCRALHRRAGYTYRGRNTTRSVYHYLLSIRHRPADIKMLVTRPSVFFGTPY